MEHRVDLVPLRGLAPGSMTGHKASGLENAAFEQALSDRMGELEGSVARPKLGTVLDPSAQTSGQNPVREGLFLPTSKLSQPASPAPDVSVIVPGGPKALLKCVMPFDQGVTGGTEKPAFERQRGSNGEKVKEGAKDGVASARTSSAASESGIPSQLQEVAVPIPSPAMKTLASQTVPTRVAQPGAAISAPFQASRLATAPTEGSDASGGISEDQGEDGRTAFALPPETSSSAIQPTAARAGVSEGHGGDGEAPNSARSIADPLVEPGSAVNPVPTKIADDGLSPNQSVKREDVSGNAQPQLRGREPQTTGSDGEIRSLVGTHLASAAHAVTLNAGVTATPQAAAGVGTNASRFDPSSTLTPVHSEHPASAVSSRLIDPYQKIDQAPGGPLPVMSAGPNRVAVGLHDPALGWVEIKTQFVGGQIAAALVTSSSQSHQTLAAQLPSMAQFLAEREVRVSNIAVHHQATGSALGDTTGSGHQGKQNAQESGEDERSEISSHVPRAASDSGTEAIEAIGPLSYISVIA